LLLQLVKIGIELETGPAGGESGHEDVDVSVIDLVLVQVYVIHFEDVVGADPDGSDVVKTVGYQTRVDLAMWRFQCVSCGGFLRTCPRRI